VTIHSIARRTALATTLCLAIGACSSPEVYKGEQEEVDKGAAGGTPNRDNTQAGVGSTIAPPGQGSALSDTTAGRLPSAGVSGPTQGLSAAAPEPRNANAQTQAQAPGTGPREQAAPKAPAKSTP
jgi:hypothetical protein